VAEKSKNVCSQCGKPFVGIIIAKSFAAIIGIYLFSMFFLNMIIIDDDWLRGKISFLDSVMPFGLEYIAIAFVLLLVTLPIIMAGIVPALEKRYNMGGGIMACSKCKSIVEKERLDAVNMAKAKEEAQAYAHLAKVEGLENSDPWIGKLIRAWRKENDNKLPDEAMLNELIMARNMEKAGNYEKAAVLLEKYHFWEEAGRMRKLDDQKVIKHITVDMNELIDQVGTKGLAIPYKCSSCGATITIDKDSKQEGLKFCSYCGTAYNIDDMTKMIQHALE